MATLTHYKQNDTAPPYTATLKDQDGVAVNIAGATLLFLMRRRGGSKAVKVNAAAAIVSGAGGTIRYTWTATDLDTVGEYEVEVEVTFSDGTVRTFPSDGFNRVIITDDIA